jgi:hypothetical protein
MILLTSHDFVIVIVIVLSLEPKTTTAPRTQNKHDQLIDQLFPRWRACTGVGEKRNRARASLNDRSTYDGHFFRHYFGTNKMEGFELALLW